MTEVEHRGARVVLWSAAVLIMLVGLVAAVMNNFSQQKLVVALISSGLSLAIGLIFRQRLGRLVHSRESEREGEGHGRHFVVIAIAYLVARQLGDVTLTLVLGALVGITLAAAIATEAARSPKLDQ